jgi:hypothetical protein
MSSRRCAHSGSIRLSGNPKPPEVHVDKKAKTPKKPKQAKTKTAK